MRRRRRRSKRRWFRPSARETPSWSRVRSARRWVPSSRRSRANIPAPKRRRPRKVDSMLYWLADLSGQIGFFNVFRYLTVRTGASMMTSLVFVFWLGPTIIDLLRLRQGKGQPIRTDGPQSHLVTKKGTPTMGGLMILSGIVVSTLLWAQLFNPYVWIVLGVTLAFGMIGFYDDYLKVTKQSHDGYSGNKRFAAEVLIAAIACVAIASIGRLPTAASATSLAFPFFKEM